jgi:hypothetical protein
LWSAGPHETIRGTFHAQASTDVLENRAARFQPESFNTWINKKAWNFAQANHPSSWLIDPQMGRGLFYEKPSVTTRAESPRARLHARPVKGDSAHQAHSKETPCTTSNQ